MALHLQGERLNVRAQLGDPLGLLLCGVELEALMDPGITIHVVHQLKHKCEVEVEVEVEVEGQGDGVGVGDDYLICSCSVSSFGIH